MLEMALPGADDWGAAAAVDDWGAAAADGCGAGGSDPATPENVVTRTPIRRRMETLAEMWSFFIFFHFPSPSRMVMEVGIYFLSIEGDEIGLVSHCGLFLQAWMGAACGFGCIDIYMSLHGFRGRFLCMGKGPAKRK